MFSINLSNKSLKSLTRSALLGGIACVTLYLGACDLTGATYKNGPVKLPSSKNEQMTDEVSRLESNQSDVMAAPVAPVTQQQSGLNPKNLFGKNLKSDAQRLDRLERAMQDLRSEFDSVKPSINRLMAIEADIQDLVGELQRLSNQPKITANQNAMAAPTGNVPPVMKPATTPKAAKPVQTKQPPPVTDGKANVYDVRVGEHPGKTRIVLDTNAKTSFSIDIDNNEKIMVVDLPTAQWSAATSKTLNSKTLGSYRVEDSENGSLLIFQLKKNAQVLSQSEIPGAGGKGQRIVIDLN